jgi:TetR/AcrR family transcriptional repressor of nem operon
MEITQTQHESKRKLLDAALHVIRAKGYTATRVEDVCDQAGLTKGSFFHHFKSKAEYHLPADPVDRLLAYVDFRKALLKGELPEFTCLVGTMVQEVYETHPALREACEASIWGHAATLEPDIAEAIRMYGVHGNWTARSLALHTQAVIQGSFILAKAHGGPEVAAESIDHLRRYLEGLFGRQGVGGSEPGASERRAGNERRTSGKRA